mmetsp:Transcript_5910/g.7031  ORF Transcript_5910/g.7031 Transcript_5910/m.7031 type:complete len:184 (+) Transcript_5910:452-1003(+)
MHTICIRNAPTIFKYAIFFFKHPQSEEKILWNSVEQCYQAMKYSSKESLDIMHKTHPFPNESAVSYGNRVWRIGQRLKSKRAEWEEIRVEVMYRINCAKYAQNEDLREELISTGNLNIYGGPSTHNWSAWNGLIQMHIRKRLQQGENALEEEMLTGTKLLESLKEPLVNWIDIGLPVRLNLTP